MLTYNLTDVNILYIVHYIQFKLFKERRVI